MSYNIVAADDEPIALKVLMKAITEARSDCNLKGFTNPDDLMLEITENGFIPDIAFLDIEMFGISGIDLAQKIKTISPSTKIIFVTGFSDYAIDAFKLHAHGYILKPVTTEAVSEEFKAMDDSTGFVSEEKDKRIKIQTFGKFEIFSGGRPVRFLRSKSKELLAYLVYRRGAGVNSREIAAILFEDREYTSSLKNQVQNIKLDMIKSLDEYDAGCIINNAHNSLSVDPNEFDCDYYDFLNKDINAINSYTGEFMDGYSWAEFTTGWLDNNINL